MNRHCELCGAYALDVRDAVQAERARWIAYVEWLNEQMSGFYAIAAVHGFKTPPAIVEEGKRRRAELGYEPTHV